MGLYAPRHSYQSYVDNYRYPLLSAPRSEIEELADLLTVDDEEEQGIKALIDNIRLGDYSDLTGTSPASPLPVRAYPAYYGLHVNEAIIDGESTNLDILANESGTKLRTKNPKLISLNDLTFMGVGIPGQNRRDGKRAKWSEDCGKALPHGTIKASRDKTTVYRAMEQFHHCDCKKCPNCLRYNTYVQAKEPSQRLMSFKKKLAQEGYLPAIYQVVLSPPQRDKDPLAVYRWLSKEGYEDLKKQALLILNDMLGALGGQLITHHFRQNGEDGLKYAGITGNDGDPRHWRLDTHFHALSVFDLAKFRPSITRDIYLKTGWVVKIVTPPGIEDPREALKQGKLKTLQQVENKMFYLLSHESIMETDDGTTLRGSTPFGGLTHRKLRNIWGPNRGPILKEGYTETDEEGRVLYWYDDLERFAPLGLENLAEVERVNSAFVYCDSRDYPELFSKLRELWESLSIPTKMERVKRRDRKTGEVRIVERPIGPAQDIPPADLWRVISSDNRFYTTFEPMAPPDLMRGPRVHLVDGLDLWTFRKDAEENDLYAPSKEYMEACLEADRREAEIMAELKASRDRYRIGSGSDCQHRDNPPEGAGQGPAIGGASPSGNDRRLCP